MLSNYLPLHVAVMFSCNNYSIFTKKKERRKYVTPKIFLIPNSCQIQCLECHVGATQTIACYHIYVHAAIIHAKKVLQSNVHRSSCQDSEAVIHNNESRQNDTKLDIASGTQNKLKKYWQLSFPFIRFTTLFKFLMDRFWPIDFNGLPSCS